MVADINPLQSQRTTEGWASRENEAGQSFQTLYGKGLSVRNAGLRLSGNAQK